MKKLTEQQQRMLNAMTPGQREQTLKARKRVRREQMWGRIFGSIAGFGCFLYLCGFLAFWVGVIYLIWRLALR
jgi:hypothetical protein